jgi:DNA-binding response OmpR family regulator
MLKMILATGEEAVDEYVKANVFNYEIVTVPFKKPLIQKAQEFQPDLVLLSSLLPGDIDIREIIFEVQKASNCRVILLGGNVAPKSELIIDAFFLGVRDFLFDPIDPKLFLEKINHPTSYQMATAEFNRIPPKSPGLISRVLTLNKKNPVSQHPQSEISDEAKQLTAGILSVLGLAPGRTIEESLMRIEQGISELLRRTR